MSDLTQLNQNVLDGDHARLWEAIDDANSNRTAGDAANLAAINIVDGKNTVTSSELSQEVVDRAAGDLRQQELYELMQLDMQDFTVEFGTRITNVVVQQQQDIATLTMNINDAVNSFNHRESLLNTRIDQEIADRMIQYGDLDQRVRNYEDMLSDITVDSNQITADNGEINAGAWTILSQARQWDLEIIAMLNGKNAEWENSFQDALDDLISQIPTNQEIISEAITNLSNAPIIKEMDELLGSAIADIDTIQADLIQEINDRNAEMISMAQSTADQILQSHQDLEAQISQEAQDRIDALSREARIRAQALVDEAAARTEEIDAKLATIEVELDAEIVNLNNRVNSAEALANQVKADLDAEEAARITAIAELDDGLTQETQSRIDGDMSITTNLENYKASTTSTLSNVQNQITVIATDVSANATSITALDTRLTTNENLAASAVTKANTALSENQAQATQINNVQASINTINGKLDNKADAQALQLLQTTVTNIDGRVTTNSNALTQLTGRVETNEANIATKLDASVIDNYSTTVETNQAIADRITAYNASLTIGAENIWRFANTGSSDYGSCTIEQVNGNLQHQKITITGVASNLFSRLWFSIKAPNAQGIDPEFLASVSFDILPTVEFIRVYAYVWGQSNNVINKLIKVIPNQWNRVTLDGIESRYVDATNPSKNYSGLIGVRYSAADNGMADANALIGKTLEIRNIQCQRGSKATDYVTPGAVVQDSINANASAIQGVQAQVTTIDGKVTSNSNSITTLTNRVTTNEGAIANKADSAAVSSLTSRVDVIDNTVTSQGTDIVRIDNALSNVQGQVANMATASSVQALTSRVTTAEGTITSQGSAITKLQNDLSATNTAVNTKASATALSALDSRVTTVEGTVSSQTTQITNISNNLETTNRLVQLQSLGKPVRDPTFDGTNAALTGYSLNATSTFTKRTASAGNPSGQANEYVLSSTGLSVTGVGWFPASPAYVSAANKIFLIKFVAKAPVGYEFSIYKNGTGDPSTYQVLGSNKGTGKYESYYFWLQCGSSGTFSTFGHLRWVVGTGIPATDTNPIEVIVSSQECWDVTAIDNTIPTEWANKVTANSDAVTSLDSRVTQNTNSISSTSSALTSLTNRVTTAENNISTKASTTALNALDSTVQVINGKVTTNTNAITSLNGRVTTVENGLANKADSSVLINYSTKTETNTAVASGIEQYDTSLVIGGANLQQGTQSFDNFVLYNSYATITKVTGGFKTDLIRVTKSNINAGGVLPSPTLRNIVARANTPLIMSFKVRGNILPNYLYMMSAASNGSNVPADSITYSGPLSTTNFVTCTAKWSGSTFGYQANAYPLIANTGGDVNTWFEFAELTVQEGTKAGSWSLADKDLNTLIDANASAISTTQSQVTNHEGRITSNANEVTTLKNRVTTVENGLVTKANASALQSLDTRVTTAESNIQSQGSSITSLNNSLTAATNTANAALPKITVNSQTTGKTFRSVLSVDLGNGGSNANIVIKTPITFSAKMFKLTGSGYNYKSGTSDINFTVGAYAYSGTSYVNTSATNTGTQALGIRLGVFDNKVCLILNPLTSTGAATTWSYPKINLDAFIGYTIPPDSWGTGWTAEYIDEANLSTAGIASIITPSLTDMATNISANASALQSLSNTVTQQGNTITSISGSITNLNNSITTINNTLTTKADNSALSALDSRVTANEQGITTQASNITRLSSRIDFNSGPGLNQDYLMVDPDSWYDHYNVNSSANITFINQTITDGPVGNKGYYINGASRFIYNKTPLPTNKKYRVQFWVKLSSNSNGATYITIMRRKAGEAPNLSWYTYVSFTAQRNNTWYYVDRIIDTQSLSDTYPLMHLGVSANNGGTAGEAWVQGFKVTEVIDVGDTTGLATSDALTALTTRTTNLEGTVATQANQITSINSSLSGKADASAVNALTTRVTTAEGNITSLSNANTALSNRLTTAEGNITSNANGLSTLNTTVTQQGNTLTSQATRLDKVEAGSNNASVKITGTLDSLKASYITDYLNTVLSPNTPALSLVDDATSASGKVIKFGDNSGNDYTRFISQQYIPIDPNVTYKVTFRVKRLTGTGSLYVGIQCANAEKTLGITNTNGTVGITTISNANYTAVNVTPALNTWYEVTKYFKGKSTGSTTGSGTFAAPFTFPAQAAYMRAIGLFNYSSATGETVLDYAVIEQCDADENSAANAAAISVLDAKVTTIDGKVTTQATSITQLQTSVNGNTSAIAVQGNSINGIQAEYTIKTDVNGLIAGIGLINSGTTSAVGVNANYFYVGTPANNKKPFMVLTSPQTIGGTTYPAGTWIDVALIANATIGNAHIGSLDAGKITTGFIDADRIQAGTITADKLLVGGGNLIYGGLDDFNQFTTTPPNITAGGSLTLETTGYGLFGPNRIRHTSTAANSYSYIHPTSNSSAGWLRIKTGKRYVLSAYVYTNSASATTVQLTGVLREGATASSVSGTSVFTVQKSIATAQGWQRISVVIETTGSDPHLVFYIRNVSSGINSYWDGFMLEEVPTGVSAPSPFTLGGMTKIEGGNITANSITADKINVTNLSAISAQLGTLVTYKDPAQPLKARMVMTGSLITVYDDNNVIRVKLGLW